MAENIFITNDNRYIGELNNIQLQYYDEKEKIIKWGNVDFIYKHYVDKPMFKVELENGKSVEVTEDHSLMVIRKDELRQSKVYQLKEGDIFVTLDGQAKIINIEPLDRQARWVYDIQMTDNPHTFFANGILVHNSQFLIMEKSEEEIDEYLQYLNKEGLKEELIKKYNFGLDDKYYQYNLEHEQTLAYAYFGDQKKRYYTIRDDGSKYVHGLNIIRKDTPDYIKELLDELCEKSVKGQIEYSDFLDTYDKLSNTEYENFAVHKGFSKAFEEYNKTMPQHVAGALFANKHFDLQIKHSDTVFLFYINTFCEPDIPHNKRKNVICLREEDFGIIEDTDKFEIDYYELMEKQIIQPMREFYHIKKVADIIEAWGKNHPDNYRFSKVNGYVFKKKKID